jgi:predicted transcriptional regulator
VVGRRKEEVPLVKMFEAPRILTLDELCERLRISRSTVIRRLQEHHYYSSCNLVGKFLTIEEVAEFDARGLWAWKGARFSKYGTLKNTVEHFVQGSERGMTHQELVALLSVRTHNVLLGLVEANKIQRERLGPTFVYLSSQRSTRREQILQRESFLKDLQKPLPTNRQVIATLLELIQDRHVQRQDVVARCRRAGVTISRDLVDAIFETYDLDKKRAL